MTGTVLETAAPHIGERLQIGERLSPAGGVAITGADLSRPLSPPCATRSSPHSATITSSCSATRI